MESAMQQPISSRGAALFPHAINTPTNVAAITHFFISPPFYFILARKIAQRTI
jgi:hypothetical protein